MSEIIIDYEKVESSIASIEEQIKGLQELFEKQNSNFKLFEDNKMWNGLSNQSCLAKYNEANAKYADIISTLNKYKKFLSDYLVSIKSVNAAGNVDTFFENN